MFCISTGHDTDKPEKINGCYEDENPLNTILQITVFFLVLHVLHS